MKYLIEVFWNDEDAGYIATVPDLPGCSAWGATPEDAIREIADAQTAWLQARAASGESPPEPTAKARHAA